MLGRFGLDIRKSFFTLRVTGHWNRLRWEVAIALILPEFKKHLDCALRHMVWFWRVSCAGPGMGLHNPCGLLPNQDILIQWFWQMMRTEVILMIITTLMQPLQLASLRVSLTWGGGCEGHQMVPVLVWKQCREVMSFWPSCLIRWLGCCRVGSREELFPECKVLVIWYQRMELTLNHCSVLIYFVLLDVLLLCSSKEEKILFM